MKKITSYEIFFKMWMSVQLEAIHVVLESQGVSTHRGLSYASVILDIKTPQEMYAKVDKNTYRLTNTKAKLINNKRFL